MESNNVLYFDFVSPYKSEKSKAGKACATTNKIAYYEYYDRHQPRFIDYEIPR